MTIGEDALQFLTGQGKIIEAHVRVKNVVEHHPTDSRPDQAIGRSVDSAAMAFAQHLLLQRQPHLDPGMDAQLLLRVRRQYFLDGSETLALARLTALSEFASRGGQVVA